MANLYNLKSRVIENKSISPKYKFLTVFSPHIAIEYLPGQFVTVDCNKFFRRPFGISSVRKGNIDILYKIVGEGTECLSLKEKGDSINIFGPLGTGFTVLEHKYPIFVAGGTGIASLRCLAENTSPGTLFYGAKKSDDIIGLDVFRKKKWKIRISTEDGSAGYKGFISEPFSRFKFPEDCVIYACGPKPMLKAISRIAGKLNIDCYISFEEVMACGVGTCRGCVIKIKTANVDGFEYKTVCKDGPVFNAKDIVF